MKSERHTGPALEKYYQFLLWAVPTVDKFPRAQRFVLGERIEATALDVLELLIAASYTRQRQELLGHANLGLEKLRFLFRLSFDLKFIDLRRYEFACRFLEEAGRLVGGWRRTDSGNDACSSFNPPTNQTSRP